MVSPVRETRCHRLHHWRKTDWLVTRYFSSKVLLSLQELSSSSRRLGISAPEKICTTDGLLSSIYLVLFQVMTRVFQTIILGSVLVTLFWIPIGADKPGKQCCISHRERLYIESRYPLFSQGFKKHLTQNCLRVHREAYRPNPSSSVSFHSSFSSSVDGCIRSRLP